MWILKLAFGLFKSYRIWIMGAAIVGVVGGVMIHFNNDANRKADLRQANGQVEMLTIDNADKAAEIGRLNLRIAAANARLIADVDAAKVTADRAHAEAAQVSADRDRISSELATVKRTLRESNDPTYKTWAAGPVPADAIAGLRNATEGG